MPKECSLVPAPCSTGAGERQPVTEEEEVPKENGCRRYVNEIVDQVDTRRDLFCVGFYHSAEQKCTELHELLHFKKTAADHQRRLQSMVDVLELRLELLHEEYACCLETATETEEETET